MTSSGETISKSYDERCRDILKALWIIVKEDGCVAAYPILSGENEGWHVYVQQGDNDLDHYGETLLEAAEVAYLHTVGKEFTS